MARSKINLQILILIGIPASGKSTWAKEYARQNEKWIRICRDDIRLMVKNQSSCEPKIESLINNIMEDMIGEALSKNLNVILDNTNLKESHIQRIIDKFNWAADINYRVFDISLDKALERNKNRPIVIHEDLIKEKHEQYLFLIDSFHFQPVICSHRKPEIIPNLNASGLDAVIFDIDGTLARMGHRDPYKDYHRDNVNQLVVDQVHYHKSMDRKILILTGREGDKEGRKVTEEWLEMYNISYDQLLMRKENDFRHDSVIKREILYNDIKPNYNVICAYDDRLTVVDMWFEEGIYCFCVNQGLKKF